MKTGETYTVNMLTLPPEIRFILEPRIPQLGVGGTIYNTHTLKPFKELGLDSQRVTKLASELYVHSVNFAAKLVHTRQMCSFQYWY